MEHIKKIVGINLILLIVYMVVLNLSANGNEAGLEVLIFAAMLIGLHVCVNALVGIIMLIRKDPRAKAFLLSVVAVSVVGFSTCFGSAALY